MRLIERQDTFITQNIQMGAGAHIDFGHTSAKTFLGTPVLAAAQRALDIQMPTRSQIDYTAIDQSLARMIHGQSPLGPAETERLEQRSRRGVFKFKSNFFQLYSTLRTLRQQDPYVRRIAGVALLGLDATPLEEDLYRRSDLDGLRVSTSFDTIPPECTITRFYNAPDDSSHSISRRKLQLPNWISGRVQPGTA